MKPFLYYTQLDPMACGSACLRMIAKYYGRNYSLQYLRESAFIICEGVSITDSGHDYGQYLAIDYPIPYLIDGRYSDSYFFSTKMVCDVMLCIGDHNHIESFMTGTLINSFFSIVSFIVFR